jgi:Zn-finger nucleic acid-binding protein
MAAIEIKCDKPLCPGQLSITNKNGVEIDYCPHCKGVWLDKGELDKILDAQELEMNRVEDYHVQAHRKMTDEPKQYRPSYDSYYKHHKKKPIWKEFFDFD